MAQTHKLWSQVGSSCISHTMSRLFEGMTANGSSQINLLTGIPMHKKWWVLILSYFRPMIFPSFVWNCGVPPKNQTNPPIQIYLCYIVPSPNIIPWNPPVSWWNHHVPPIFPWVSHGFPGPAPSTPRRPGARSRCAKHVGSAPPRGVPRAAGDLGALRALGALGVLGALGALGWGMYVVYIYILYGVWMCLYIYIYIHRIYLQCISSNIRCIVYYNGITMGWYGGYIGDRIYMGVS